MKQKSMRFRLQRKTPYTMPNVLGGHSFPVYTYRWKDIAMSDYRLMLEEMIPESQKGEYRIEDIQSEKQNG